MTVPELIASIRPADGAARAAARRRWDSIAKPLGSLGALENIYIRLCGSSGKLHPVYSPCRIIVLCADNGVVEEGVSVTPRSVTAAQAVNMTNYCTGMSAMAHHFGDEIQVVDVGIADEYDCPAILNRRILPGTRRDHKGHRPVLHGQRIVNLHLRARRIQHNIHRRSRCRDTGQTPHQSRQQHQTVSHHYLTLQLKQKKGAFQPPPQTSFHFHIPTRR